MFDDLTADFGAFDGQTWLNTAHQGALPQVAVAEAKEAILWKTAPFHMTTDRFSEVPVRLREALAQLTGALADDIVLANSASYGLHLLANGIPFRAGEEVLLMEGDFPSDILPWLGLRKKGVRIRFITPRRHVVEADELESAISPDTRVFCTTLVHSFSGWSIDLDALGEICRRRDVRFVVNASQATGARPVNLAAAPIDAITSAGFKWLCGPYGTGFLWMREALRESLEYNQAYWLSMQTADDLGGGTGLPVAPADLGARRYDIFGTANFFNFKPWTASIEYLAGLGVERIAAHDQSLVSRLIEGLQDLPYRLLSPPEGPRRSTLVLFSHHSPGRNHEIWETLRSEGIHLAYRNGNLRAAPHLYNTPTDIDRLLDHLRRQGS